MTATAELEYIQFHSLGDLKIFQPSLPSELSASLLAKHLLVTMQHPSISGRRNTSR
jgi:hypothetical protein